MPAKTTDIAAKKKKQTIMLVVGGVLLAGLMALQLPKLMGGGNEAAAPQPVAAGTTPVTAGTPVTGTTGTASPTPVRVTATKSSAVLAGVVIKPASGVDPEQGDLASFGMFESKDPFDPQVSLEDQQPPGGAAESNPTKNADGAKGSSSSGKSNGGESAPGDAPAAAPTYATIMFNGQPQPLEVKGKFPKPEELFVLVSLKPKSAKISVNGGSFSGGKSLTLTLGKRVTLVNTATGARYVLKLVYTGDEPEEIEGFSEATTETEEADEE